MSRQAVESGRIIGAIQDGSREFISLLSGVCADGTYLPPALIYKGESNDLQNSWVADLEQDEEAYFAASNNGWSSNLLGQQWLEKVFERHTSMKAGNRRRLLIVDGHSSHVNLKFLEFADSKRILVMILPPHSTHRLQPLDVGLFSPLARAYTNGINKITQQSLGMTSMSKRLFWGVFREAYSKSFTPANIMSAFAKPGIWPFAPTMVGAVQRPPNTPQKVLDGLPPTPKTYRGIKKVQMAVKGALPHPEVHQLIRINESCWPKMLSIKPKTGILSRQLPWRERSGLEAKD
jgi:hypothetical protein